MLKTLVKRWMAEDRSLGEWAIEKTEDDRGPCGEDHVEHSYGPSLKNSDAREGGEEGKPKFNYVQANILVKAAKIHFICKPIAFRTYENVAFRFLKIFILTDF